MMIETADGPMELEVAEPTGTPRGAIVVIQEAFGLTDHIRSVCRWLADDGWLAVAPALFHRHEQQVFAYGDFAPIMPIFQSLTAGHIETDLDATFAWLAERGHPQESCGMVGFCMGGSVTLHAASTRRLGAAVDFYGGGLGAGRFGFPAGLDDARSLQTPLLGLFGDLDGSIPVDEVEQLRAIVSDSSLPTEIVRYDNGQHGFNCDDRPEVFDADIAADARPRTLTWFATHLTR